MLWLSARLHRLLYGYPGYLCARAAWRQERFWRVWRWVFDLLLIYRERGHCEACFWRLYRDWAE